MESELQPVFDEERHLDGGPRAVYDPLLEALEGVDLVALQKSMAERLRDLGVTFGSRPFVVDPVPRLITASEWRRIEVGLVQRTRALNRFLLDAYGPQRAVAEGILSRGTVEDAEGFEAELVGRLPPERWPAAIIGFDLVRDAEGEFLILEDNVRTPSGYAYALAAREALQEALQGALPREGWPVPRPIDPATFELLAGVMRAAGRPGAPPGSVVVLTDGPGNVAYYEHARAAERLGAILATPDQLDVVGERLGVRLSDGSVEPVGVVYRRTDEDRAYDERGELTDVAAVLLPAWLAGNLGLVNAFGNGLADDKLVHGHVEDFIRFYLEEEPLLRSVPTSHVASEPEVTIANLAQLVVKPRHGHGGKGVVIGPHAQAEDLEHLAQELARRPEGYISQPLITLSRVPTVIDGQLRPRHVDLRPFAFAGERVSLMPGGLSRVAFDPGALVVNSSQNGGGKDTWVVD